MPECGKAEETGEHGRIPHPDVEHLITQDEPQENKQREFTKSYLRVRRAGTLRVSVAVWLLSVEGKGSGGKELPKQAEARIELVWG